MTDCIERIKIDNVDVFLEELGAGKGKITLSDTYNHNYSYFWGSMGCTLKQFLCRIDAGYFAKNLIGSNVSYEMDVAKTFTAIRKFISSELDLPWYKFPEFQKDMREKMRGFQSDCEESQSEHHFVSAFHSSFINRLDYYLIDNPHDRKEVERNFKYISECWNFIEKKHSKEYLWLMAFHGKLKKLLLQQLKPSNL